MKLISQFLSLVYGLSTSVVSGVITWTLSGRILGGDGSAAAPTYSFSNDPDTGMFLAGTNLVNVGPSVQVSTGGLIVGGGAGQLAAKYYDNDLRLSSTIPIIWCSTASAGGTPDTGLNRASAGVVITTNGSTGAGYFHTDRLSVINNAEGGTGRINIQTARDLVTLTGASTDTTTISAPAGCLLLGASFTVNTAVEDSAGDDTWSAAYVTGATTALATGAAAAQNTKVNKLVVPELATAVTQIRFTPQGGNFTAGVIEVVAYYIDLTSLAN